MVGVRVGEKPRLHPGTIAAQAAQQIQQVIRVPRRAAVNDDQRIAGGFDHIAHHLRVRLRGQLIDFTGHGKAPL